MSDFRDGCVVIAREGVRSDFVWFPRHLLRCRCGSVTYDGLRGSMLYGVMPASPKSSYGRFDDGDEVQLMCASCGAYSQGWRIFQTAAWSSRRSCDSVREHAEMEPEPVQGPF